MNANVTPISGSSLFSLILGIVAALIVVISATGLRVPFLSNERVALVSLVIVGMAMCTRGIGRVAAAGAWASPLSLAAIGLGALILIIGTVAFLGKPLPLMANMRQAIVGIGLLGLVKLGLSLVHRLLFA